jgi:hypothetical protein
MRFKDELRGIADHIILQARCFGCEVEAWMLLKQLKAEVRFDVSDPSAFSH